MRLLLFCFCCFLACKMEQQVNSSLLQNVVMLKSPLKETSGLASGDDKTVYTHNDSGNQPDLYQISPVTGEIKHTFHIHGVKNTDWEELASDSNFIYIGDFGNNEGIRTDLVIYKVEKSNLIERDTNQPQAIRFFYPEQSSFFPGMRHNFDCEAMIAVKDSLYLFTKNRGNLFTDVYRLPKTPGQYPALHINQFNTRGLVTAADLQPAAENKLVLLGYEIKGARFPSFLWVCSGFQGTDFFSGTNFRIELAPDLQAEAILFTSDTTILITNEDEWGTAGKMYKIDVKEIQ